jgi:hypothetical protein
MPEMRQIKLLYHENISDLRDHRFRSERNRPRRCLPRWRGTHSAALLPAPRALCLDLAKTLHYE